MLPLEATMLSVLESCVNKLEGIDRHDFCQSFWVIICHYRYLPASFSKQNQVQKMLEWKDFPGTDKGRTFSFIKASLKLK